MPGPVLREIEVRSVITKSNLPVCDYSVNPYVGCTHACRYCYASFMKRFTGHAEPWGGFIDVKYWPEIKNPSKYKGKEIFIGSVTDPYNPQEAEYQRTRAFLEQMQDSGARISIATKSDLVLRDLELIRKFPDARVSWSVNTLDEDFKNDMDDAVSIGRRLDAMRIFHDEGIRTTCFISPIFPGLTDVEAIIEQSRGECNLIWLENLNLRGGSYRSAVMGYIRERRPDLLPLYEDIFLHGSRGYWEELDRRVAAYASGSGLRYVRNDDTMALPFDAPPVIVNFFYHEEVRKPSGHRR